MAGREVLEAMTGARRALILVLLSAVVLGAAAQPKLGVWHCARLSGAAADYCTQFVAARDSLAKYKTASEWARFETASYLCSGITALCLNDDIKAPRPYNTTCRVLPDEARGCGDNPDLTTLCAGGVCMYASGLPVPARADVEDATLERARAFSTSTTSVTLQELRATRQGGGPRPGAVAGGATPQFGPDLNLTVYVDADTVGRFVPASFIGISREYTNESIYWDRNLPAWGAILDVLGPSPVVRLGGASQEALTAPPTAEYMRSLVALHCALGVRFIIGLPLFQNAPALALQIKQAYDQAFANFPRAILSYELGNEPNFWPSGSAGAFIWGTGQTQCTKVNYPTPPDIVPNGAGIMQPPGTYGAAGNYYLYTKYRPPYQPFFADQVCFTPRTLDFYPGWARFASYFGIAANTATGCNGPQTPEQSMWARPYWGPTAKRQDVISGPAWGTLRVGAQNLTQLIALSRGCFWNEATVHYYTPVANRNATIAAMLNDVFIDEAVRDLRLIVDGVQDQSRVRVSEVNSVAGGGRGGVSNVFAAALWTAQIAFEFANAGASGANFHWGNAGLFSAPGAEPAYIGVSNRFENDDPGRPYPVVRAPWYGYLLFARATGRNGQAIVLNSPQPTQNGPFGPDCSAAVSTYTYLLPATSEISVTAINKSNDTDCTLAVAVNGDHPDGTITRLLPGRALLSSINGITWGGATYEGATDGRLRGTPRSEVADAQFFDPDVGNWTTTYYVKVPRSSAALLLVPTSAGGAAQSAPVPLSPEEKEAAAFAAGQRAQAGLLVPQLPQVYGALGTAYRAVFGNNAEAERVGQTQYALQSDGTYRPVNTPLPVGPVTQGLPRDGGAGIKAARGACPGIQKIAESEKQGLLLQTMFTDSSTTRRRRARARLLRRA